MKDEREEERVERSFSERLAEVRQRIEAACVRSGRDPGEVLVLPVTKNFGPDAVRQAADCGLELIGENRVQEARYKIPMSPGHLRWHMIGHLQRNKAREAVRLFDGIQSIDSLRILEAIDAAADEAGVRLPVYLEVNVAGESSKHGFPPEEVEAALEAGNRCARLEVQGLMTIPPFAPDPEDARPHFAALRELRDRLREKTGCGLDALSMGMSNDFEVAVEEGATCVRLGSLLFGSRKGRWRPDPDDLADL